jgi:hypothetical protein
MKLSTLQTKLISLGKTLRSFSKLNMKKQCIQTLFKILKVEKQIEELETSTKEVKMEIAKSRILQFRTTKDSECGFRNGDYGVRCSVNGVALKVHFSEKVDESRHGSAEVTDWNDKPFLSGEKLMKAVRCQAVDNVWTEYSREEVEKWVSNSSYVGGRYYYTHPIITFINQFGETEIWHDNPYEENRESSHPSVKYPQTWRNADGQPIDHQQWCDNVVAYLKDSPGIIYYQDNICNRQNFMIEFSYEGEPIEFLSSGEPAKLDKAGRVVEILLTDISTLEKFGIRKAVINDKKRTISLYIGDAKPAKLDCKIDYKWKGNK